MVGAADPAAPLEAAADDPAADVDAALLLLDELVPDEQAASARPAAASPAMSFRLRARRTLFSSSHRASPRSRDAGPAAETGGGTVGRYPRVGDRASTNAPRNRIVLRNGR